MPVHASPYLPRSDDGSKSKLSMILLKMRFFRSIYRYM